MVELGKTVSGIVPAGLNKKAILHFVAGVVIGYIIDEIIEYIVINPETKKYIDLTGTWGSSGIHGDDLIQWFAWAIIAIKYHAFGIGGFIGCTIGSFTDFFGMYKKAG